MEVTLVDAGTGNLRSVFKALETVGARVQLTQDPQVVALGGRVVLPGVGAFGDFMKGLRARGLEPALLSVIQRGDLLLGICVGMQALFEMGEEMGEHRGLGVLPGRVVRFPDSPELKVPHTGWNGLDMEAGRRLWRGLHFRDQAYFNHSYYCLPDRAGDVAAYTEYGLRFASSVEYGSVLGVQFHPEKSQRVGLTILQNFLKL